MTALDWLVWSAFAFEYLVRLALTDHRWRFFRRHCGIAAFLMVAGIALFGVLTAIERRLHA